MTSPWLLAIWGIDILGPFTPGKGQTNFLLVGVDYLTKWIETESLASISDGKGPNTNSIESPPTCQIGPLTRAMAKKLQEDWNNATDGKETYLYMLKTP